MIDEDRKRKRDEQHRTLLERFIYDLLENCIEAISEEIVNELFEEVFGDGELGDSDFDEVEVEIETEDSDYY